MNYSGVVSTIRSMFNNKPNTLIRNFSTTNKKIFYAYYLATGIDITETTNCYMCTVQDKNNIYKVILGRSEDDKVINDILFIDNEPTILCIMPEKLFGASLEKEKIASILFDMYSFIIDYTCPVFTEKTVNTIYGFAYNLLPMYLTVYTIVNCFTGFDYDMVSDICTKEQYDIILENDNPELFLDYSYIYALFKPETEV